MLCREHHLVKEGPDLNEQTQIYHPVIPGVRLTRRHRARVMQQSMSMKQEGISSTAISRYPPSSNRSTTLMRSCRSHRWGGSSAIDVHISCARGRWYREQVMSSCSRTRLTVSRGTWWCSAYKNSAGNVQRMRASHSVEIGLPWACSDLATGHRGMGARNSPGRRAF